MASDHRREGLSDHASHVLSALREDGPEMPIVVLARVCGLPPTVLALLLDELHDAGYVEPGSERRSVRALPVAAEGRFRSRPSAPGEPVRAPERGH